jgi:hypothetical protein
VYEASGRRYGAPKIALDNGALRALVPVANKKEVPMMSESIRNPGLPLVAKSKQVRTCPPARCLGEFLWIRVTVPIRGKVRVFNKRI